MGFTGKKRGLTFIETIFTSVFVGLFILSSMNLMSRVYRGITAAQLKTISLNLANEHVELYKYYGFDKLGLTPDDCVPLNMTQGELSKLSSSSCPSNPWPAFNITEGPITYTLYTVVRYAHQSEDDFSIKPVFQADTEGEDIKQIQVITAYVDNNIFKVSEITSLVSNKQVPTTGSIIEGTVSYSGGGNPSDAVIYVIGHPEYTTHADTSGDYTIENVMPGSFYLYANGTSFLKSDYASNPLACTDVATTYSNIDFTVTQINYATITGTAYADIGSSVYKVITATGEMSGASQDWYTYRNIRGDDCHIAFTVDHDSDIYTDFYDPADLGPEFKIDSVKLFIEHLAETYTISGTDQDEFDIYLTMKSGASNSWCDHTGDCTRPDTTVFASIPVRNPTVNPTPEPTIVTQNNLNRPVIYQFNPYGTAPNYGQEHVIVYNPKRTPIELTTSGGIAVYKIGDATGTSTTEGMYYFPLPGPGQPNRLDGGDCYVIVKNASEFDMTSTPFTDPSLGFKIDYEFAVDSDDPAIPNMIKFTSLASGDWGLEDVAATGDEIVILDSGNNIVESVAWGSANPNYAAVGLAANPLVLNPFIKTGYFRMTPTADYDDMPRDFFNTGIAYLRCPCYYVPGYPANTTSTVDVTDARTTWSWTDLQNLGVKITTDAATETSPPSFIGAGIQYLSLIVKYHEVVKSPKKNVLIKANDGTSTHTFTDSNGNYELEKVDPTGGTVTVYGMYSTSGFSTTNYYGEVTGVPVASGATSYCPVQLTITSNTFSSITGEIYDADNRTTLLSGINITIYLKDRSTGEVTKTATTSSGTYTMVSCPAGSWDIAASAPAYILEKDETVGVSSGLNTAPKLYLGAVGRISGIIRDESSNALSGIPVELRSSTQSLLSVTTTASDGSYAFNSVRPASGLQIKCKDLDLFGYEVKYPVKGKHTNINISAGSSVSNKNFTLTQVYTGISGSVSINLGSGDELITDGALIIAYPAGTTHVAYIYRKDLGSSDYRREDNSGLRKKFGYWSRISDRNGNYYIRVPSNDSYDIYAFYTKVTWSGYTRIKTMYYTKVTGISPPSTGYVQNFSGIWTVYP